MSDRLFVAVVTCGAMDHDDDPYYLLERSIGSALAIPSIAGVLAIYNGSDLALAGSIARTLADRATDRVHRHRDARYPSCFYGPTLEQLARVQCIDDGRYRSRAAALNHAIGNLEVGVFACVLDAGDVFYPAKERQLAELADLATFAAHHDRHTGATWLPPEAWWREHLYMGPQFAGSTMVFDRGVWETVGGFDADLETTADWEFAMRVQHEIGWQPFHDVAGTGSRAVSRDDSRELAHVLELGRELVSSSSPPATP